MPYFYKVSPLEFSSSDSGAVTVDWVFLTAALVGLGLATMSVVSSGVQDVSADTQDQLQNNRIIRTSFALQFAATRLDQRYISAWCDGGGLPNGNTPVSEQGCNVQWVGYIFEHDFEDGSQYRVTMRDQYSDGAYSHTVAYYSDVTDGNINPLTEEDAPEELVSWANDQSQGGPAFDITEFYASGI